LQFFYLDLSSPFKPFVFMLIGFFKLVYLSFHQLRKQGFVFLDFARQFFDKLPIDAANLFGLRHLRFHRFQRLLLNLDSLVHLADLLFQNLNPYPKKADNYGAAEYRRDLFGGHRLTPLQNGNRSAWLMLLARTWARDYPPPRHHARVNPLRFVGVSLVQYVGDRAQPVSKCVMVQLARSRRV